MRSQYNTGTCAPELNAQDKWGWRGGKEGENQKPCHWLVPPTFIAAFFSLCTLVSGYLYKYKNNRKEKKTHPRPKPAPNPLNKQKKKKSPLLSPQRGKDFSAVALPGSQVKEHESSDSEQCRRSFQHCFWKWKIQLDFFLQLLPDIELSALQCSLSTSFQWSTESHGSVKIHPHDPECLGQVTPLTAKEQSLSLTFLTLIL